MKALTGLAIGAIALGAITLATSPPAQAQMGKLMDEIKAKVENAEHAKVIYERRSAMKKNSAAMKEIAGFVKKDEGTKADVAAAAQQIASIAGKIPDLFPRDTGMSEYEGVTGAKPVVWSDSEGFKEAAEKLQTLATELEKTASAENADKESIGTAFATLGKEGCGGCHRTFREKLN